MNSSAYDDIIQLERPISRHPSMSLDERAAQFAPYATLNGHREIVAQDETSASEKINLDHEIELILDEGVEEL